MKIIMSALAACVLLAGIAAPANADQRLRSVVEDYVKLPDAEKGNYVKLPRNVPRQIEHIADSLDTGSSGWWQQMDRERRGGRR